MKIPLFIRSFSENEQRQIQAGLRSSEAFVLRGCQILTLSARRERALAIARQLGCDDQTVRNVIHGFNAERLAVLQKGSSRPHRLRTAFSDEGAERLKDLLHHSPRDFGKERSTWTLELAAQVSFEQGIIPTPVSDESVRRALKRLKTTWKWARHWITSPDPQYLLKKIRDRLMAWASRQPDWAIGFLDEVWWSRFALPRMHAWQDDDHSVHLVEQFWQKGDPNPKALACYGILWQRRPAEEPIRDQMSLRDVPGRPVSDITTQFLQWGCEQVQAQRKVAWLLIWNNASWYVSKTVHTWIRAHNSQLKAEAQGGAHPSLLFADQKSLAQPH